MSKRSAALGKLLGPMKQKEGKKSKAKGFESGHTPGHGRWPPPLELAAEGRAADSAGAKMQNDLHGAN